MSDPPKSTCFCGVSVHLETRIVALISIIYIAFVGVLWFPHGPIGIWLAIAMCIMLIFAVETKRSECYLAYFALIVANIGFELNAMVFPFIPSHIIGFIKKFDEVYAIVLVSAAFLIGFVIFVYFFLVIPFHSYMLTRYEVELNRHKQLNADTPDSLIIFKNADRKPGSSPT
ncbi:hypothetical protein M3Y97_01079500 [Aphelenchoides bicaudatus]|nr:hypothetical protein M3Y97_01079500 [Aphelenchoides bicaudatus]